jgi:acetyl esterase/lipase
MNNYFQIHLNQVILLALIVVPFPSSLFAQPAQAVNTDNVSQKWLDIDYAGDSLQGHKMDIYLPKGEPPFPVVVSIAGSAWLSNNTKTRAFTQSSSLLNHGFAIAAVNHRASTEAIFPAQINDIKGVVRFLRANASKYQLDTRFVGIIGDSSGGHLAALMGTSGGVNNYTIGKKTVNIEGNVGGNTNQSSRVDAVSDWYGPTLFYKMDAQGSQMNHDEAGSPESTLVGGLIQENHELCELASPLTYIDANDPNFLIIHGDADPLVPHGQSVLLKEALTGKKVKNEMFTVPGGGHGGNIVWTKEYTDKMAAFFTEEKNKKIGK